MRKTARRRAGRAPELEERMARQVAAAEEEAGGGALAKTLQLGALFGLWYLCGIYYNICIKQVLKAFPYPLNITTLQFAVGTAISLFMWITGILKKPKISCAQLAVMLSLAMVHALFTNMRFQAVGVSSTHRWHAMWVVMTVVPIVGGVALASISEASLTGNRDGSLSTMAPNVTFQSSNVLSKKLALKKEESLDNINLFSIITVMSFLFLAPVTLLEEGLKVTPSFLQSAGLNLQQIYGRYLIASFCFHAYQQLSYILLARVLSPATQSSLNNFVEHMVLIVTSVLFLRSHLVMCLPFTFLGTVGALAGVFLYSQLKRLTKPKAV